MTYHVTHISLLLHPSAKTLQDSKLACNTRAHSSRYFTSPTSGPVSTGMGYHAWVQFPVRDIYLGM